MRRSRADGRCWRSFRDHLPLIAEQGPRCRDCGWSARGKIADSVRSLPPGQLWVQRIADHQGAGVSCRTAFGGAAPSGRALAFPCCAARRGRPGISPPATHRAPGVRGRADRSDQHTTVSAATLMYSSRRSRALSAPLHTPSGRFAQGRPCEVPAGCVKSPVAALKGGMIGGSARSRVIFARFRAEASILSVGPPSVAPRARRAGCGLPVLCCPEGSQRLGGQGSR
jgi:hypothetical protein